MSLKSGTTVIKTLNKFNSETRLAKKNSHFSHLTKELSKYENELINKGLLQYIGNDYDKKNINDRVRFIFRREYKDKFVLSDVKLLFTLLQKHLNNDEPTKYMRFHETRSEEHKSLIYYIKHIANIAVNNRRIAKMMESDSSELIISRGVWAFTDTIHCIEYLWRKFYDGDSCYYTDLDKEIFQKQMCLRQNISEIYFASYELGYIQKYKSDTLEKIERRISRIINGFKSEKQFINEFQKLLFMWYEKSAFMC